MLTAGCDVQHSGLWVHIDAWALDAQVWTIASRFLEGDTTDPSGGAFLKLQALYDERFEDQWGNLRLIDGIAIDAGDGGRANQVYAFVRGRPRCYAIKGMPGWSRPALGTPSRVSITLGGRKIPGGAMLWPVGTWDLKAEFYADLRKDGRKAGREMDPPGYCHHGMFLDEGYFRQITAEYLADAKMRGRTVKVWRDSGPNHLLDARTYSRAVAEHLGLMRMTDEQWKILADRYSVPPEAFDLFAGDVLQARRRAPGAKDRTDRASVGAIQTRRLSELNA
jgi:phage terminase large subunit GpA-like protein